MTMETTNQAVRHDNAHSSFWPEHDITLAERLYNDYDTLYKMLSTEKGVMSVTGINELTARIISEKFYTPAAVDNMSAPQLYIYDNNAVMLSDILGYRSWSAGAWSLWLNNDARLTYIVLERQAYDRYKNCNDIAIDGKYMSYRFYRHLQLNNYRPEKDLNTDICRIYNVVLNIVLCEDFVNIFEIARCIRNELLFYWRLSVFGKPCHTQCYSIC